MSVQEGIFQCPNCKEEQIYGSTKWQKKIINNEEKWIFYRNSVSYYWYGTVESILALGYDKNADWIGGIAETAEECWNKTNGFTENEYNIFTFVCHKCKYQTKKSFTEFIPNYNKSSNNNS